MADQFATEDRVRKPGWWPTKGSFPHSAYLGDGQCARCQRFPPYRIENSRCWGKGDARLTCVACHDPHRPLQRDATYYDQRCLSCHVNSADAKPAADHPGSACPVARKDCVTCHMPKARVEDIPVEFTDHQIRVVRPNASIPK